MTSNAAEIAKNGLSINAIVSIIGIRTNIVKAGVQTGWQGRRENEKLQNRNQNRSGKLSV